jgi:hypothetical protein
LDAALFFEAAALFFESLALWTPDVVMLTFASLTPTVNFGDLTPTLMKGKEILAPPEEMPPLTDVPASAPRTTLGRGTVKV